MVLWPIESLTEANAGYKTEELFPDPAFLGSNGGGEAIAVRQGTNGPELVLAPFIGATDDVLVGGNSLWEFLSAFGSGKIWKRRRD